MTYHNDIFLQESIQLIPDDDRYASVEQLFLEEISDNYKRYRAFFEDFKETEKGIILIVISHGLASNSFREYLDAPKTIIDYWWITLGEFDTEDQSAKPNWIINWYSNHTGRPADFQLDKIVGTSVI